jgi:hypothetical protein
LRGLEWNCGFGGALRTNRPRLRAHAVASPGYTLNFALFTPLWIVLELFVVKEQLFAGGEDKVITAI